MTQNPAIALVMRGEANVGPLSTTLQTFEGRIDDPKTCRRPVLDTELG